VLDEVTGDYLRTTRGLNALGLALVGLDRRREAREGFAQSLDLFVTSGLTGGEGPLAHYESVEVWYAYGIPERVVGVRTEWHWSRLNYDCVYSDSEGREIARKDAPTRPPWSDRAEPGRPNR
jgi:hypothetical protein